LEPVKLQRVLDYVADSVETGYSSVFTFAVKEILNSKERGEFAEFLRNLTHSKNPSDLRIHNRL
jgi:hypothetical protein